MLEVKTNTIQLRMDDNKIPIFTKTDFIKFFLGHFKVVFQITLMMYTFYMFKLYISCIGISVFHVSPAFLL